MNTIKVDIWSDIACPWCFIGKGRFEAAIEQFPGRDDVVVEFHSYELVPDTPVDFDGSQEDFLTEKGMSVEQVRAMYAQVSEVAAADGLQINFDSLRHANTLKAHELLHYAKAHDKQAEVKERLLKAYFTDGRHVGKVSELAALAVEVGLDADEVTRVLESGEFAPAVAEDIAKARELGISGVPFFVIDGKYGVSGAQTPEAFVEVLTTVAQEKATDSAN